LSDKAMPPSERLGTLLVASGLADQVRAIIENQVDSCIDLDSLAELITRNVEDPKVMAGKVLSLMAFSTHNHEPVLALRTHLFINEVKNGQLCHANRFPEEQMRGGVACMSPTTHRVMCVGHEFTQHFCAADVGLCTSKLGVHSLFCGPSGTVQRNLKTMRDGFFAR
jgi:hypothetical protein